MARIQMRLVHPCPHICNLGTQPRPIPPTLIMKLMRIITINGWQGVNLCVNRHTTGLMQPMGIYSSSNNNNSLINR